MNQSAILQTYVLKKNTFGLQKWVESFGDKFHEVFRFDDHGGDASMFLGGTILDINDVIIHYNGCYYLNKMELPTPQGEAKGVSTDWEREAEELYPHNEMSRNNFIANIERAAYIKGRQMSSVGLRELEKAYTRGWDDRHFNSDSDCLKFAELKKTYLAELLKEREPGKDSEPFNPLDHEQVK